MASGFAALWPGYSHVAKRDLSNLAPHPDTSKATKFPRGDGTWVDESEVGWTDAPASSTSTGTAGQCAYDDDYLYVCIATDTWRRTPLADWS